MTARVVLLLVLIILIGYGLVKAEPLIAGPSVSLTSPAEGAVAPDGILTITGGSKRAVILTLNGAPLFAAEDGSFSETLAFPKGDTILTLTATDRFKRSITITRTIVVP